MNYLKHLLRISLVFLIPLFAWSQRIQSVRGIVIDSDIKSPLFGAIVKLAGDSATTTSTVTDVNGQFKIPNVPIGRYALSIKMLGYSQKQIYLNVTSGKEVQVTIELQQQVEDIAAIEVSGSNKQGVNNEMTLVSTRNFTVEETERYAGSRQDPARMASNFAGVQGADDSRNDIVIRGNSPYGVLWRIEGIDVVNPNHFAVPGTTGSAINLLNSKTFANSDFLTGAFPAEYGNAIAGVFDIKLRNGNAEKHEFSGQFGLLGTELFAEGPLSKKSGASYLVGYRYSTLKIFQDIGIKIGTNAAPAYQDANFRINLPAGKAGTFAIFGFGGTSKIDIVVSNQTDPGGELYGDKDRDQYFRTRTAVTGISHTKQWNDNTYTKTVIAVQQAKAKTMHELVFRNPDFTVDTLVHKLDYLFITNKATFNFTLNKRLSKKSMLRAGIIADGYQYDLSDSTFLEDIGVWNLRLDYKGMAVMLQPFILFKHKFNDRITMQAGVHGQWFSVNKNSTAIEPRFSIAYQTGNRSSFSLGYGLHNQAIPYYLYFAQKTYAPGVSSMLNSELGFFTNQHVVAGYDYAITPFSRIKAEVYYQHLTNVPVDIISSSYSILNQGASFSRIFPGKLVNKGTGDNYGMEFTLERFFTREFFFLLTTSLYNSTYSGSDGIKRNTDFNGNFVVNAMAGKEFNLTKSKSKMISTGAKVTWAGGQRYTPADVVASNAQGELVVVDSLRNIKQFRNYFRVDVKLGYKFQAKKVSHEVAVDLVNVLGIKNILGLTYVPVAVTSTQSPLREEYQLGFLPLFYYKIDF
ncbi:MAG: TonB-dependent receptor [Bacteroidetes bacterium]|nr:TonB-dependent receptor [Bacteroidota bacterium]